MAVQDVVQQQLVACLDHCDQSSFCSQEQMSVRVVAVIFFLHIATYTDTTLHEAKRNVGPLAGYVLES